MVRIHTVWHRQLRRNESLGAFFFQVRVSRLESSESSALCSDVISLSSFASRLPSAQAVGLCGWFRSITEFRSNGTVEGTEGTEGTEGAR